MLYGTIPEFVPPGKRTHAFAIFCTGGAVAGAACVALTTVPMVWALRPAFRDG